ncbi:MAG: tetratricopeptide repeat protein [Candidatus Cloacimonadales bacterium]|nr:tetratricopeptide repeat protein [Candidatus Cloacimonadota bacterium]MDD3500870.1 tetratricopeptide repeat protein [Candidatus Cloacimonadota bacterium]MDX9978032.1 tetratricopeptide repeat protein [Candidatus Cloacimonadales bacterium]
MKKSLLLVILSILIILPILAQDKLVIIGVDAEDSESRYIKTILEKRDIDAAFKNNEFLQMVPLKESAKALKDSGYKGAIKEIDIDTVKEIANAVNAEFATWMWIMKESQTSFYITGKTLSLRTDDMINYSFTVTKNKDVRAKAIEDNLVQKNSDFAKSEIGKMFNIAEQNFNAKKYKEAEENFLRLKNIDKDNPVVYYYLGMIRYQNNDFPQAVTYFEQSLEFEPDNENCLRFLSETYKKQGNLDKSIEVLSIVANTSNDPMLWLAIAQMHSDKNNIEEAKEALENGLRIEPDNERIHMFYATFAYDNKDYEKAIPHLEFVTNIYPDSEEMGRKLAISYQRTGRLEEAIENYKALIARDNQNTRAYLNLGAAYRAISYERDADKYNRLALETYQKLEKLMPESGNVDVSLADIYLNMKNYNQSEKYANIAISKDSGIYEAYMILADINQKRGFLKQAEFVDLQKKTDSGDLYGKQLDDTIAQRDKIKAEANKFFVKADELFKVAKEKTDNPSTISDINHRIQNNKQYIDLTKKDFFN